MSPVIKSTPTSLDALPGWRYYRLGNEPGSCGLKLRNYGRQAVGRRVKDRGKEGQRERREKGKERSEKGKREKRGRGGEGRNGGDERAREGGREGEERSHRAGLSATLEESGKQGRATSQKLLVCPEVLPQGTIPKAQWGGTEASGSAAASLRE